MEHHTHQDALADRIGIMAYGSLRCIGSSLHLKAKFGAGHKIDIVVCEGAADAATRFMSQLLVSRGAAAAGVLVFVERCEKARAGRRSAGSALIRSAKATVKAKCRVLSRFYLCSERWIGSGQP